MREIVLQVYTFDELAPNVQKKVIEKERMQEDHIPDRWFDFLFDEYACKANKELGITEPVFSFSGFWTQGDGASVSHGFVEMQDAMKAAGFTTGRNALDKLLAEYGEVKFIKTHGHKYDSGYFSFDCETGYDRIDSFLKGKCDELQRIFNNMVSEFAYGLYRALESEYEHYNTDKAIAENLIANEYEYFADGKPIL